MKEQEHLFDPVDFFWRQFGVMEEGWAKAWEMVLADPNYSKGMGQMMDFYLSNQQLLNRTFQDFFTKVNLPTKQDIASVANQVQQTEQKVNILLNSFEQVLQMQKELLAAQQQKREQPPGEQLPPPSAQLQPEAKLQQQELPLEELTIEELTDEFNEPAEKKSAKTSKKKAKSDS